MAVKNNFEKKSGDEKAIRSRHAESIMTETYKNIHLI